MAWKSPRTGKTVCTEAQVDVSISEFDEAQMLQGLIDAGWLSDNEAEKIKARAEAKGKSDVLIAGLPGEAFDPDEMIDAYEHARRGNRMEALLHLGRALGREWYGVLN